MSPLFVYLGSHSLFRYLESLSTKKCCLIFNRSQKSCWEVETALENSVSDLLWTAASKELYKAGGKEVNEQAWALWNIYCSMNLEWRGEHDEAFPLLKGDIILLLYQQEKYDIITLTFVLFDRSWRHWFKYCILFMYVYPYIHTHTHVKMIEKSFRSSNYFSILGFFVRNTSSPCKMHSVTGSIAII